jgi:CIC family chloride channel protein
LTAVVFVAEATGGHAYIIPVLIGAAVAYAISGEASVSGDQRLHEGVKIHELQHIPVEEIMQTPVVSVDASNNLQEFSSLVAASHRHHSYPVFDQGKLVGTVSIWALASVNREDWPATLVGGVTQQDVERIAPDCDVQEALRILVGPREQHIILVVSPRAELLGVVTKTDILSALDARSSKIHHVP